MSYYIKAMDTIEEMQYLTPQQEQDAIKFYQTGRMFEKNNDFLRAANYYKSAAALGHAAAQNSLGNLYKDGKGVEKDLEKAFSSYLDAAIHGNVLGMRNLAICYYNGQGIGEDFDLALSWLRTATLQFDGRAMLMLGVMYENKKYGDWEKAKYWYQQALNTNDAFCQEKAKENLSKKFRFDKARNPEELFNQREGCFFTDIENTHYHGKEYYNNDVDFTKYVFQGKIYYKTSSHICCSNLDATDICRVAEENGHYPYIVVNATGIYVYKNDDWGFDIKRFDFYGNLIRQYHENQYVENLYVYDDNVYFVQQSGQVTLVKRANMETGQACIVYRQSENITRLFAMENKILFSHYSNWYLYNIMTQELTEFVNRGDQIESWDLNRGIYWERNGDYLVPRPIFGKADDVVPNAPVWKIEKRLDWVQRCYFDGVRCFCSDHYYQLLSLGQYGEVNAWKEMGHAECDRFEVVGGYIFVNLNAEGEEQYYANYLKGSMLRKSWFD